MYVAKKQEELFVPANIVELVKEYGTEEACLAWVTELRDCPDPACVGKIWWRPKRMLWRCSYCGRDVQFGALTDWEKSHVPLTKWFEVAWWMASKTVSIRELQRLTGLSRMALHRVVPTYRREMTRWAGAQMLEGDVEVDEAFLGWNGKRGRASKPAIMFLAERNGPPIATPSDKSQIFPNTRLGPPGLQRVVAVQMGSYTKAATCERLVLKHVKTGSAVYTDDWAGYAGLNWFGYDHHAVNVSKASAPAHVYLPAVHSAIHQFRDSMRVYSRHPTEKYFPLYLGEWSWRYSNRHISTGERWAMLIGMINKRT
jgi:transposase-like protein